MDVATTAFAGKMAAYNQPRPTCHTFFQQNDVNKHDIGDVYAAPQQQDVVVDVSLDLMQYLSSSWDMAPAAAHDNDACAARRVCPVAPAGQQEIAACPSILVLGSSCSAASDHALPHAADYRHPLGGQPPCKRCRIDCSGECSSRSSNSSLAGRAAAPSTSSSCNSSSDTAHHELLAAEACNTFSQEQRSSCMAYDDDFVWQCYYGDPNSKANREQQRPKLVSPFAVFCTFPGFSV